MALGNEISSEIANFLGEEIPKITHEDLVKTISSEIDEDNIIEQISLEAENFIKRVEEYEELCNHQNGSLYYQSAKYKIKFLKNNIYTSFFNLQNLINEYNYRRVVMTYVHIDDSGRREIRISDNDIGHLETMYIKGQNHLKYVVEKNYQILKQTVAEGDQANEAALQEAIMEIDRRYTKYTYATHHMVLWYYPGQWKGYQLTSMGPINEAFVDCYVHNIQLLKSLEGNIDTVMEGEHGAIKADATKGFMIGDIAKDGVQYAVKGKWGSPQGFRDVYNYIKKIKGNEMLNKNGIEQIVRHYTTEEEQRELKPQIKKLSMDSLNKNVGQVTNSIEQLTRKKVQSLKLSIE